MNMKIDRVFGIEGDARKKYLSAAQTKKITDLLETSVEFEKGIKRIRKKFSIPEKGLQHPEEKGTLSVPKSISDAIENDCWELAFSLNLPPDYWQESLVIYAIHGIFLAPSRRPLYVMYNQSDDYPHEYWFDLVISENISKKEFFEEMEKEWPSIKETIKSLPKLNKNKMVRSEWAKRVVELRDTSPQKTPFKEVATALEIELYNKGIDVDISEDYAKMLYKRWKLNAAGNTYKK